MRRLFRLWCRWPVLVRPAGDGLKQPLPDPEIALAVEAVGRAYPVAVLRWQIARWHAGAQFPHDGVQKQPVKAMRQSPLTNAQIRGTL